MITYIDADLVAFRCAASADGASEEHAVARCDNLMREIIHATNAESYCGFLTGRTNFRKQINPEYKANRKGKPLPQWLNSCKEFLITEWNCKVSDECEADDYLGIAQDKTNATSVIASLDKDLLMIPGLHYNWVKDESTTTSVLDGLKYHYKQMLIGDRSDNIFGVDGIGKVKAGRLIDSLDTEQEMIETVFNLYDEDVNRFLMNAQCLWIMQNEGETWAHRVNPSILTEELKQGLEATLGSTTFSMVDISMEPTTIPTMTSGIPVSGELTDSMEANEVPLTWSIPDDMD